MSYRTEKTSTGTDIVISGFENGIAVSPHKGIANLQNVNIATESGEVMASFGRTQQSQSIATGTFTYSTSNSVILTTLSTSATSLTVGTWVTVTSGITGLSAGTYYVMSSNGGGLGNSFSLATQYTNSSANIVSGMSAGSCTFTIAVNGGVPIGSPGKIVAKATETYNDSNNTVQYRYYMLTEDGLVWVSDTSPVSVSGLATLPQWFLPDKTIYNTGGKATGLAVLNGWIFMFQGNNIWCKSTAILNSSFSQFVVTTGPIYGLTTSTQTHTAYVGHQGALYYTDGNFIGKIFPNIGANSSYVAGVNIQSFCSYAASGSTGTISTLINGSFPTVNNSSGANSTRIPVCLFTVPGGHLPSGSPPIVADTLYWLEMEDIVLGQFKIFPLPAGGLAFDLSTGVSGTQYFNTFYPISSGSIGGGSSTIIFTPQRLNLPVFETAQCMTEIGNTLVIGCKGNVIYPWNQIDPLPGDLIPLPENNAVNMITVNNMAYIFAGNKGNVYVTNGNTASLVITVPDYCAGIPGTPQTYIEPYFVWGDADYVRGRVYCSILDQTSIKVGNCGGIWSFVPTQNFFVGQDTGLSLRLENQNSYGSYNGVATIILKSQNQVAKSPQYYTAWYSNISNPLYGIDFTATTPIGTSVIETDLIPTGTLLNKKTFEQIEYKLASPLSVSEVITINYRLNATDAWLPTTSVKQESTTDISGYFTANFQNTQWVQLQVILNPLANGSSTFCRLSEIRIR